MTDACRAAPKGPPRPWHARWYFGAGGDRGVCVPRQPPLAGGATIFAALAGALSWRWLRAADPRPAKF
jgi:hypothetical protein